MLPEVFMFLTKLNFKNPAMLKRLQEINTLADDDKHCILYTIDGLLRDAKARITYQ